MKVMRWHEMELPPSPLPREVFARCYEWFMEKVPEDVDATVEVVAYTEKGDPPYNPDVKHLKFIAEWGEEVEDVSKLGQSRSPRRARD